MNWSTPREDIVHRCENFRDFGNNDKISKKERYDLLINNNYSCRYCGGIYKKYLIGTYVPTLKVNDVVCRMCYLITHLNYGFYPEMKLYYSEISQLEIIKKTVEYIIDNNEMPEPHNIDKDVRLSPISLLEYINLLNCGKLPLVNYKIFFSDKLNVDFVVNNYMINAFIYDKNKVDKNKVKELDKVFLKKHIPTKEELDLLKVYN